MTIRHDPLGIPYDFSWEAYGITHYERSEEAGGPPGGSRWSSENDCNPICGCHLSSKCMGCGVCTSCDGCYCYYCYEDEY